MSKSFRSEVSHPLSILIPIGIVTIVGGFLGILSFGVGFAGYSILSLFIGFEIKTALIVGVVTAAIGLTIFGINTALGSGNFVSGSVSETYREALIPSRTSAML